MHAMPNHAAAAVALLLAAAQGCAVQPELGWEASLERRMEDRTADFAHAPQILRDRDAVAPGADLIAGDEVLYGVCLDVHERRQIWYLRVVVLEVETKPWLYMREAQDFEARVHPDLARQRELREAAFEAEREMGRPRQLSDFARDLAIARIRVEAFDAAGVRLGSADSEEAVQRLRNGLFAACVAGHARRGIMGGRVAAGLDAPLLELDAAAYEDVQTVAEGVAACDGFFAILKTNPVTRKILFEVIALPTLWSMIKNFGVRPGFSIDFFAATPVEPRRFPAAGRELWSVPIVVQLNDQPALLARIIAGPSGSPDGAAAGVYGLVGQHPAERGRSVHIQLLGSRRGPALR